MTNAPLTLTKKEYGLVNNLLDNAIRHSPYGGKVILSLCLQDGKPILKITDAGPGIAEAEKYKIFQRFYRIPGTSSSGAGLGLSIVQDVAHNHGAIVSVRNGPGNIGTTFCIVFRPQAHCISRIEWFLEVK